jgi:predicted anti-sigma-YlaC factor YlaD
MLSCKEITELVSKEVDDRLSLKETFELRMHVMMCNACRNYRTNVQFLRQACREAATLDRPDAPPNGQPAPGWKNATTSTTKGNPADA